MDTTCSYLRVVVTTRCNYACPFCHMEGDPHSGGAAELPTAQLVACLRVAGALGMKKIKYLGGEPLLRPDLPEVIRATRAAIPDADLSIITAGALPVRKVAEVLEAGLDRINVSIHGFSPEAFALRNPNPRHHARRAQFLAAVLEAGRPLKLNYVFTGPDDLEDLGALLDWAAPRGVLVNVLDDLGQPGSWRTVADAVMGLRGIPVTRHVSPDPHSLDTLRWVWQDGLEVELKHQQLGQLAPYAACMTCPKRAQCKEGIFALRLTHQGVLAPCMDRQDLGFPLAEVIVSCGEDEALARASAYLRRLTEGVAQEAS